MAITQTNKLGLPLYSAGTDPHPGRVDHNTIMQAINDNAMGVKQGLHASRPGAGVAGRTYFSTDRSTFSYDTGTTWADYTPIGGVAPSGVRAGATGPVLSAAGGNEGTSERLARADHTHALPVATDDLPGLLSADLSYLLARMTDAATPSTMVRRDSAARISVGTPTAAGHAATKSYADLVASNASNLTTGTVAAARLPLATASAAGAMSAADKSKLDASTWDYTGGTIMQRDANGNVRGSSFYTNTPQESNGNSLARKDYVDGQVTGAKSYADGLVGTSAAPLSHTHAAGDTTSGVFAAARLPLATASAAGAMSAAHFSLLAGATNAATPNTLVRNDASGRFQTVTPASAADVANKGYVDGKTWDASDIVSGLINQARIANATSTLNGLMSSTDKAKLDAATYLATGGALAQRTAAGQIFVGATIDSQAAASKSYVDDKTWDASDIVSGLINQARIANATASLNGLMSSVDKAKLDSAGYGAGASALMMTDSRDYAKASNFLIGDNSTPQPNFVHSATRKDYVDAGLAKQVSLGGALASGSINGIVQAGEYWQPGSAQVTTANGYPYNGSSGHLKVMPYASTASGLNYTYVVQHWTSAIDNRQFFRSSGDGGSTWRDWVEVANSRNASALAYAAADGPGAVGSFDTYTTPGPYILQGNGMNVPTTFLEVFSVPSGGLYQRRTVDNAVHVRNRLSNGTWTNWMVQ